MKVSSLLISDTEEHCWHQVLEDALASLGTLQIEEEKKAVMLVLQRSYDIIIVDATAVKDVPLLVSRIRGHRPDACIVVATAVPTWTRAREAFYVGATDYIRKSSNREEILSALQTALAKSHRTGRVENEEELK